MTLAQRGIRAPASPIRQFAPLAVAAKAKGLVVHHLNIGEPDFTPPPSFFEALHSIPAHTISYEPAQGSLALREAWAEYVQQSVGVSLSPDYVLVTVGASEALSFAFSAVCDPGDEIVMIDPCYANYLGIANHVGVVLRAVPVSEAVRYIPADVEAVAAAITSRTKALLLCSPNNPGGSVYPIDLLQRYLELCEARGLTLILDESYREFVYDGAAPQSLLHALVDHPHLLIVDSLSKRFSLCGIRIGFALTSNAELWNAMHRMAQARLAAPSLAQFAASRMLQNLPPDYLPSIVRESEQRRSVLCESLSRIGEVSFRCPQGAFYLLATLPVTDTGEFVKFLLSDFSLDGETVFLAPAAGFYASPGLGRNQVRIAFVLGVEKMAAAARIIGAALEAYRR